MKHIALYLKPKLPAMLVSFMIKVTGTVMDLLIPWILAYMIDNIVPQRSMKLIGLWAVIMAICAVFALLGNVIANRMASKVARDTTEEIRHDLFSKITHLSCKQVDRFTIPSLISRLSTDTYNIHQMVGMIQRLGVRAPILLFGGVAVTFTLEPVLTLVMLCTIPPLAVIVFVVAKKGITLFEISQRAIDKMVRVVRENISGIRVIKALSKEDYEKKRFDKVNNEVIDTEADAKINLALSNPAMNFFLNLGLTAVIIVGAYRVNAGVSQTGKIIAFMTYFTIILNALLMMNRIFTLTSKGAASARRISKVLLSEDEFEITPPDHKDTGYHIEFKNVSFAYSGGAQQLKNISFSVKKGDTLGIIGTTGCGKTTLLALLLRFYDSDSGEIRINGDNIKSIPLNTLRDKFGVTFQKDFILADTIAENISFERGVSKNDILKSIKTSQAEEFISSLDDGIDYSLTSKGTNVSGGQRQRILISRAIASKPEILILDDSSSALDYKTDAALRRALKDDSSETTKIIVAQRVSSISTADLILVMDNGEIVGMGRHDELMKTCEQYRLIADSQMGAFDLDGGEMNG